MVTVAEILSRKGSRVVSAPPETSILDAAILMNQNRVGSLVVIDDPTGDIVGILSERDILTRLVAAEREPRRTAVRDIMTSPVVCCERTTSIDELRATMHGRRIRHIPVRDGQKLCGLVSIGDVNAWHADGLEQTVHALEDYVTRG